MTDRWLPIAQRIERITTYREVRRLKLLADKNGRECPPLERPAQNGKVFTFKPQILIVIYDWLDGAWQASQVIIRGRRLKADGVTFQGRRRSELGFPLERLRKAPVWVRELVQEHRPTHSIVLTAA